ncbi:Acylamidase [Roseobacter fucihabitans]|uniref:Acylamidase n=1 Tax=Roseobacter fucihabitans TaxID=1537242 RepID=A0ABZ2BUN6_9RHOB|nr:amidase [Roseobacter litoralis]MBC6967463.1 Acylamidase [Roseobacter litoralis]
MELARRSALALSNALAAGDISAQDLMSATLARIDAVNPKVNAIVSMKSHAALMDEARACDQSNRNGWLHGIPIAIKDLANARGFPTSKGSPIFAGKMAAQDDLMVARLRGAGAIVIGKTNTPEFGLGSHTFNPVHGATANPYDPSKSAGGSSGGAAVALATGMLCVADGSDMMGSLRNPAGWNNVYGMRPTWGVVPAHPEGEAFMDMLATEGPMARTPGDLAALLDTMAGPDPRVPFCRQIAPTLPQIDALPGVPEIAWLGDWGGAFPMEPGVLALCEAALSQMQQRGWSVDPLVAPFSADAMWQSWIDLRSYRVAMARRAEYDDPVKRALLKQSMIWEIARGRNMSGLTIHGASETRSDWFRCAAKLLERFDVLALPSAQLWPFDIALEHPTEIARVQMDIYHRWMQVVVPASLIGLPVVNVPIGFGAQGLPMGLQLMGRPGSDGHLLQIAQKWHEATGWPQKNPAMIERQ